MARPSPAAAARHPHLEQPVAADRWRVDLHSHTMWSGDSTSTPDEVAAALTDCGLDAVCITDHQAIAGAVRLADELPCRVIVGEEVRTTVGELIGLFLSERVPPGLSPSDTARIIREQGGVVYVPHPFDPMRHCLAPEALDDLAQAGLIDAVEVLNAKTSLQHLNRRAAEFADRHGLAAGAGSDAHVPDAFGAAYVEMVPFDDAASFLAALRHARVVGHHWDQPRPWTARVVPSTSRLEASQPGPAIDGVAGPSAVRE